MKYEFRIGDYIRVGEQSGYLTSCNHTFGEYRFTFVLDDGKERGWSGPISELPSNITRIGQYEFTKKAQAAKIDKLAYAEETAMLWKLNELVDAVNRIEEKFK